MASTGTDDFENGWTLVDKDGQIDIEVSLSLFQHRLGSDSPRILPGAMNITSRILFFSS